MRYKKITSSSNPLIKAVLKEKRIRQQNSLIVEGRRLLEMALAANSTILKVFFTETFKARNENFLRLLSRKSSELVETSEHVLSRLADTETPQGIVALVTFSVSTLAELSLGAKNPLIVVCDGIRDPGNIGAIIRTADAAGADAVVLLPGTCDPFSPKAVRATAGSIFNLPVLFSGPYDLVEWLRKKSVRLIAADVRASTTIYETDMKKSLALAFGNEAAGVSEYLKRNSDLSVSIPIQGKAESLNVAAAVAVCLYEAFRQRRGQYSSSRRSR